MKVELLSLYLVKLTFESNQHIKTKQIKTKHKDMTYQGLEHDQERTAM